jgi:hypothetical protein
MKMRLLTLFTATLAGVLALALGAQAATLSISADQETYAVSDTITLTITGSSTAAETAVVLTGSLDIGGTGSATFLDTVQSPLMYGTMAWAPGGSLGVNPILAFDAISPYGTYAVSAGPLTSVMTFHATSSGTVDFDWAGGDFVQYFDVTGAALGTSITIIPEPTTAGLMGLGLVGLAISGRRRKS